MIDFDKLVLGPIQAIFGRPIWVTPLASAPGAPSFWARGDYRIINIDLETQDGILSEQTLKMGVRIADFTSRPMGSPSGPKDQVYVPPHMGMPEAGPFWIDDTDDDPQGHTIWSLKSAPRTARNIPPVA